MVKILYLIGLCWIALPVWGAESIVLRTGFRLAADRHEVQGEIFRIYSGGGVTELPARLVVAVEKVAVEQVESPSPEAPPAAPAPEKPETPVAEPPPVPDPEQTPLELARSAAQKYSLPDAFVAGVMRAESGFNARAVSPKGAIGLMQLMPGTARDLGVDPAKPVENADAGARYLRDLLAHYEGQPDQVVLALAAYNAGSAAVEKYHGVPPFRETREYILRVLKAWNPQPVAK